MCPNAQFLSPQDEMSEEKRATFVRLGKRAPFVRLG